MVSSRDCKAWKDEMLPLSTTNNESAKLFDDVITQYVTWTDNEQHGGIEGTLKKMNELEPDFVMGKVISFGLDLLGTGRTIRLDSEFAKDMQYIESLMEKQTTNSREKLHCKAILQFAQDDMLKACETWEDILVEYPNDMLALKFAHDSYFYLGDSRMIRDSVARVLPGWKTTDPLYGYIEGMFAFGLEEMNMYDVAEKYGRGALTRNPTDCWATHAVAHCLEMTGRANEGVKFMRSTENNWSKGKMLACHNYWHWALYHIENGEFEEALNIYDQQVGERVNSGAMLDIVDAASLLKRLEFQGADVVSRWNNLYDLSRPHVDDHITVFNDAHFLMCYLGGSGNVSGDIVETFMNSVQTFLKNSKGTNRDITEKVGLKLFQAVIEYSKMNYDGVVELMYPVKNDIITIGGSHAQRDVFNQLLLQSAISAKKPSNKKLARALLHERKLLKENSPLTDRMISKLLTDHA